MIPIRIAQKCAHNLWLLTESDNEWGGQLLPDKQCILHATTPLIKGTRVLPNHPDGPLYSNMQIATTPFYKEVFQKHPLCDTGHTINVFFHTHPARYNDFAPPSVGDFIAHTLFSNYRNYIQNNQLNTCLVVAHEGIYVYYALTHRFRQFCADVADRWARLKRKTAREKADYEIGELPPRMVQAIKKSLFATLHDTNMDKKHYLAHLNANGFHYEFFPAPFTADVQIIALTQLKFQRNGTRVPF